LKSVRLKYLHIASIVSIFYAGSLVAQEAIDQTGESEQAEKIEEVAEADDEPQGAASKFRDPEDGKVDISQHLLDSLVGFMPIPIIITEPAVDNGIGIAGVFFTKQKPIRCNLAMTT